MNRFFYTLLLFLAAVLPAAEKPNILIFIVDDMGVMDSSQPFLTDKNGKAVKHPLNNFYKTPAMEALAARGVSFTHFYANSVCSPTRASLMNGQYSARHKVTQFISPEKKNAGPKGWRWSGLNSKDITMPKLMQAAGYTTIFSGKAHFAPIGKEGEDPTKLGFDINIAGCAFGRPGSYLGTDDFGHANPKQRKRAVPGLKQYHGKDIFLTEALTLEINKALTTAVEKKKPFFAYMSHYAVHSPFQSDKRFAKNYTDSGKAKSAQAFATLIEGMDKSLGDIIKHLETLGVAENTLVMFIGDNGSDAPLGATHGYSSSAPLRGKKGTHYEGGMRVPFIAAWAKTADNEQQKKTVIKPGLIDDEFATICDVFPTVLAIAGAKNPETHKLDGQDIRKFFAGEKGFHKQEFLMHFPHGHRSSHFTAYREKNLKLIYHYKAKTADKRYELFDLSKDPYEKDNIAQKNPEKLQFMLKRMKEKLADSNAQYNEQDGKALVPE